MEIIIVLCIPILSLVCLFGILIHDKLKKDAWNKTAQTFSRDTKTRRESWTTPELRYQHRYDIYKYTEESYSELARVAYRPQKGRDWALEGGMANGIAGPAAGVATALNAQKENEKIRAANMQLYRDSISFAVNEGGRAAKSAFKNAMKAYNDIPENLISRSKVDAVFGIIADYIAEMPNYYYDNRRLNLDYLRLTEEPKTFSEVRAECDREFVLSLDIMVERGIVIKDKPSESSYETYYLAIKCRD